MDIAMTDKATKDLNSIRADRLLSGEGPEQISMFGEEQEGAVVPVENRGPGRPAGSGNKLKTKVREYMAARGYRDPVEQLAMLAGLDRPDLHPLGYAAVIARELGEDTMDVAKVMRQAAADLLPYYHAKLTPDVSVQTNQMQVVMAAPGAAAGPTQRVVGPPPMPTKENLKNQQVIESEQGDNSDKDRTE